MTKIVENVQAAVTTEANKGGVQIPAAGPDLEQGGASVTAGPAGGRASAEALAGRAVGGGRGGLYGGALPLRPWWAGLGGAPS